MKEYSSVSLRRRTSSSTNSKRIVLTTMATIWTASVTRGGLYRRPQRHHHHRQQHAGQRHRGPEHRERASPREAATHLDRHLGHPQPIAQEQENELGLWIASGVVFGQESN